jgi:hypothetical protein
MEYVCLNCDDCRRLKGCDCNNSNVIERDGIKNIIESAYITHFGVCGHTSELVHRNLPNFPRNRKEKVVTVFNEFYSNYFCVTLNHYENDLIVYQDQCQRLYHFSIKEFLERIKENTIIELSKPDNNKIIQKLQELLLETNFMLVKICVKICGGDDKFIHIIDTYAITKPAI